MGYTIVALKERILEMYPEIERHGINLGVTFDEQKNAYIIRFNKGVHELSTHLDKDDADECMDGIKCVHLGVQIGEFIKNFGEG
ncbi:MAG: hypothetical protein Fur0020_13470 [Thermodesulfovibrionia bacterium]